MNLVHIKRLLFLACLCSAWSLSIVAADDTIGKKRKKVSSKVATQKQSTTKREKKTERELKELKEKVAGNTKRIQELQSDVDDNEVGLDDVDHQLETATATLKQQQAQILLTTKYIRHLLSEHTALTALVVQISNQNRTLSNQVEEHRDELDRLKFLLPLLANQQSQTHQEPTTLQRSTSSPHASNPTTPLSPLSLPALPSATTRSSQLLEPEIGRSIWSSATYSAASSTALSTSQSLSIPQS